MKKILMTCLLVLSVFLITGCSTDKEEINILATTDLHGEIPYKLSSYVKNEFKKDRNLTLVDAGDFLILVTLSQERWVNILIKDMKIKI
jgi:2',3'-cyclic-nucleotide 2'-phosphodiesterase (5'-nucleotidase family)